MTDRKQVRVAVVDPVGGGWEVRLDGLLMGVFSASRGEKLDYADAKSFAMDMANMLHHLGRVDRVEIKPLPSISGR